MFTRLLTVSRRLAACALVLSLAACGGQDAAPQSTVLAASSVPATDAAVAMHSAPIESSVVTMHGGGASVISTAAELPAAERDQLEQSFVAFEQSFAIEKNRQHDEWLARQKAAEEAIRNGTAQACQDPSGYDCPVKEVGKEG